MYLAFDTQYSNGKDGKAFGGWDQGQMPASGVYQKTWVVAPGAPPGKAIVWVSAADRDGTAFRQPIFLVAGQC